MDSSPDGSVMIDNEVIYYAQTVRGPDVILTSGISPQEFNKKRQALESPWTLLMVELLDLNSLVLLSHLSQRHTLQLLYMVIC